MQKKWKPGIPEQTNECEECNCHGHSTRCLYDEEVDERHESMDLHGNYEGGGVCQECKDNTEGNNCERCKPGFFRPHEAPKTDPCQRKSYNYPNKIRWSFFIIRRFLFTEFSEKFSN